ncbi:Fe-S cluster assembly sulfur transfer protein SufU [Veillonella magna]|uniref:SUF system NifU family Fe-S cluster assembly protein n=1 Tax=Veillonella magna TaxID=464322 RepID=A0ABS2GDB8_9FIRM|nr:SUF system NifU family Fe-S cluster assembly protein [Veillonella magna]MBM6823483.1 SUF system NifU family Fe-S cluster assembly protein [Veillonella magna]MBM6911827.1 SUF system NifU family Fe-S cluster assembly protein [Veillonella magna]
MEMDQLYTELILEHNQDKRNKRELAKFTTSEHGHNPSCGDDLTLQINVEDGIVKDAAYTGSGCAISQASASMMIDIIQGKSLEEAMRLVELFLGMIKKEVTDDDELEELEDAIALKNISNMPARVKCAVLAWHTLKEALKKEQH